MMKLDLTAKYVLAVSGGVDSMTMLHMFASLSPRPDFSVITVNHNIRKQAQADCEFVQSYCNRLGVACRAEFVDVPQYAEERKLSTETAARILRYGIFDKLDCDFVCLAQTVLMHILRGSGAQGARGIRAQNGKYLRPLLDMTREQIEEYALRHDVPYVHDSTNDDVGYTRNFVRNCILPQLRTINANAERNIVRFAENIAEDCDYLDGLADVTAVEFNGGCARIPTRLLQQPKPVAYRTINKVFNRLGVVKDIEKTHIDALINLADGSGGRRVDLPFGFVAVNDYGYVTLERSENEQAEDFELPFTLGVTHTPAGTVEVSRECADNALRFDCRKLPDGAVFRLRRQGDVFTKFGGGTKPLKKYLIDKKIPQRLRDNLILIAKGNEVYVICGVEISDKVKAEDNSDVLYVTVKGKEATNEAL